MDRRVVMCAADLGPLTRRVLYHAAGMARALDATLQVVHVDADTSPAAHERVLEACLALAPYEADFDLSHITIRAGRVSDVIHREARHQHAAMLVIGSRGHGGLAKLLLGSTSRAVLKNTATPTLIVPHTDMDIVGMGNVKVLSCGPVVAAVDLAADCSHQLRMAGELAALAGQPLLLMTVARARMSDHDAAQELRARAEGVPGVKPTAFIVRRGDVVTEISRCAVAEGTGLVVMGLATGPRARPGAIASGVLKTGRAFVLAVPGC